LGAFVKETRTKTVADQAKFSQERKKISPFADGCNVAVFTQT